ncbi:hypothetical protein E2C01_049377 [Portunus trituberculatus]|uniref:Uncharacterized protein n=1 Tax=Portunus trituberculatus TaxID=210409 RepID=A0A5B7G9A3_PORTR|nr:hypothetical protein [Portunus trituberculatus]
MEHQGKKFCQGLEYLRVGDFLSPRSFLGQLAETTTTGIESLTCPVELAHLSGILEIRHLLTSISIEIRLT